MSYTRAYLIRHGHLVNSHKGVYNGHSDIELSPEGVAQTTAVAACLKDKTISAIYSSDLRRSLDGAKIIAASQGLEVIPSDALREINLGCWEGLTPDEIRSNYTESWDRWLADPIRTCPPGGETIPEMQSRVIKEFEGIIKKHAGEEIVLFTHAGVNRIIICYALNLAIENCFRIQQDFCKVNIIDFYETTAVVKLLNGRPPLSPLI
ncbi:MAG: histidine phosphatase family protein [Nitrospirae bacterium]|nr:histidine phosphatase family protein [Nitrospirota bacterium]